MRLLSIEIDSPFNSLQKGFKLQFRPPFSVSDRGNWNEFQPYCLVGLNGSGKSNLLEALANIFFHLECCVNVNHPENFVDQFSPSQSNPSAFRLEYYIKPASDDGEHTIESMVLVTVVKEQRKNPEMTWTPYPFSTETPRKVDLISSIGATIPAGGKNFLPDLIVGYSSGENETLSIPFIKSRLLQFDEYAESIKKDFEFEAKRGQMIPYQRPESSLLYVDYEMSQAVLLVNYIFQDDTNYLLPLAKLLGIIDVKHFRMNLNIGHKLHHRSILDQYERTIEKFKNCATSKYQNESKIWLDFFINKETKDAFRKNFSGGAFELFQSFQVLYTLNYRTTDYITKSDVYRSRGFYPQGKIGVPPPNEKVFYFLKFYITKSINSTEGTRSLLLKQLSDGEQQFLHSLGICLILRSKSTLLLLDEPETHFNPDWRSKFISMLGKSLAISGGNNLAREVMLTSHSPFIISDCRPDKVIYFKKSKSLPMITEAISAKDMNFITFGASVDLILEVLFGKHQSIGNLALQKLKYDLSSVQSTADIEKILFEISELGESLEKDMLLASLAELNINNAQNL